MYQVKMSKSKTLKCASCNVVISELLAYLQNKVDVMDNESMVRICASAYTIAEVEEAKSLLFDTITTKKRNISRRKDGKIQRDLEDIIAVLKETDPNVVPVFVARNLNKIPVFCYDHLDPSVLLKDIVRLKADIQEIKQTYVTVNQMEEMESKWKNCRPTSLTSSECRVNNKRGGYLLDSGPMGFLTPRHELISEKIISVDTNMSREPMLQTLTHTPNLVLPSSEQLATVTCGRSENGEVTKARGSRVRSVQVTTSEQSTSQSHSPNEMNACEPSRSRKIDLCVSETKNAPATATVAVGKNDNGISPALLDKQSVYATTARKLSFAELAGNGEEWIKPKVDEKWIQVQRKRLRNRFVGNLGKAEASANSKFKAADARVPLFVSNVHKAVLETDIVDYIYEKTKERVSLLKIDMKRQRDYNSYKMFVNKQMIDIFLNDKLWPSGISFRRFVSLRDWQGDPRENKHPTT